MEFIKAIVPWVILVLTGLLYSRQKKRRAEALARQLRGDPTPPEDEPTDNYLLEGLIVGLALGWLASYLKLADSSVAMSFGVIIGFCAGLLIKKKPKNSKKE